LTALPREHREGALLRRKIHPAQEVPKARGRAQAIGKGLHYWSEEAGGMFWTSALKPYHGTLPFPPTLRIRVGSARGQAHEPPDSVDERLPPRVAPEGN
jgi:hypothetical protein